MAAGVQDAESDPREILAEAVAKICNESYLNEVSGVFFVLVVSKEKDVSFY